MKRIFTTLVLMGLFNLTACHFKESALGTEKNPIKFYLVPSVDIKVLGENSKILKEYLEKNTPYKYKVIIPQSFAAVVDAFGNKQADVGSINTYGYYTAHNKHGVEARLTVIRNGLATYQSQFLTHANSKIKSLKDLSGKKVAFVDPSSVSGYLMPLKTLKDRKIEPKEIILASSHDSVVSMIYEGQADGGATYYNHPQEGNLEDARRLLKSKYPDIEEKVKIIEISDPIPNDPIVFRNDISEEIKENIVNALIQFVSTPEGQKAVDSMFGATNFKKATDADYETVREMVKALAP
ncbi:MAG: phosphate/phosphite/phosphonate ABC transporter substrate-binding protein [Pseudobdellovibrionaceae bacterium]